MESFLDFLKNGDIAGLNHVALTDSALIEQFVNSILHEVEILKQNRFTHKEIGAVFNTAAEAFRFHAYFSIDRFDGTVSAPQQEIENDRLLKNWEKWYTYKLLARYYTAEDFSYADTLMIDKSMRLDDLSVYRSPEYYEQIFVPGKPFYDNANAFGEDIYAELTEKLVGFSDPIE
jgi:hypothetical protein